MNLIQIAESQFDELHQQPTMQQHTEAMQCCDCEDKLEKMIDVFGIIVLAQDSHRENVIEGRPVRGSISEVGAAIDSLYRSWAKLAKTVAVDVRTHERRGYELNYLSKFQECLDRSEEYLQVADRNLLLDQTARGEIFTPEFLKAADGA